LSLSSTSIWLPGVPVPGDSLKRPAGICDLRFGGGAESPRGTGNRRLRLGRQRLTVIAPEIGLGHCAAGRIVARAR